jgi:hypothetical protein
MILNHLFQNSLAIHVYIARDENLIISYWKGQEIT